MAPNKTLAAQLANEFRELLPQQRRRVLRRVLRLLPARGLHPADGHLHREGLLDQRRGRAAAALGDQLACSPAATSSSSPRCRASTAWAPRRSTSTGWSGCRSATRSTATSCCAGSSQMQYTRNDLAFTRGTFRVRGDTIEIIPVYEELAVRIEMFGDEIEALYTLTRSPARSSARSTELYVFPASHYVAGPRAHGAGHRRHRGRARGAARRAREAGQAARGAAAAHAHHLRHRDDAPGRLLLRHRELLAAHRRPRRRAPRRTRLLDYFPEDFLLVIDESHVTVPQIGAMYEGDTSRKRTLVDHGFRLPSRHGQPPAEVGGVPRADRADRLPLGHARAVRAGQGAAASSSRSSGPPAWSTRRSSSSRPRARSTTCSTRSASAPTKTSASWSPP